MPYDYLLEKPMNKKLRKSKTFWINLATVIGGVVTTIGGSDLIQDNPELAGYGATAIGAMNIVLRLVTGKPIKGV